MSEYTLSAKITADASDFKSDVKGASDSLSEFGDKCSQTTDRMKRTSTEADGSGSRFSGFTSMLKSGFSGLSSAAMGFGVEIGQRALSAVADLTGEMVAASDSADKFASTLSFAGIDDGSIKQLTASTQEYADKTVYDLADIRNATAQLAANGVADYATVAEAAGNLNAVAGGNADTFKSVSQALTQTAGAGKLTTENWNQLTDAIPGASGALQQAMRDAGAFEGDFREAMANGEISAEEFTEAVKTLGMNDVAIEAAQSTSTIEGAAGNLVASIVGLGSQAISAVKPFVTGAMAEIAGFISNIPATLQVVGDSLLPVFQPAIEMFQAQLMPALSTLGGAFMNLGTAVMPVLQAAFATAAPVLSSIATGFVGIATTIAETAAPVINGLAQLIGVCMPFIQGCFNAAMAVIGPIVDWTFNSIENVVNTVMGAVQGLIDAALGIIRGDWKGAWNGIKTFFSSIWNGIKTAAKNGIDAVVNVVKGIKDSIVNFFSGCGSWLLDSGKALMQGLADGITGAISWVTDKVSGAIGSIRDLFPFSPAKEGPFSGRGYVTYSGRAIMRDFASALSANASVARNAVGDALGDVNGEFSVRGIGTASATDFVRVIEVDAASYSPAHGGSTSGGGELPQRLYGILGEIRDAMPESMTPREFRRAVAACG